MNINFTIFIHSDDDQKIIVGPIGKIAKTTKNSFSYKTKTIFEDATYFIGEFINIGNTRVIYKKYTKNSKIGFSIYVSKYFFKISFYVTEFEFKIY